MKKLYPAGNHQWVFICCLSGQLARTFTLQGTLFCLYYRAKYNAMSDSVSVSRSFVVLIWTFFTSLTLSLCLCLCPCVCLYLFNSVFMPLSLSVFTSLTLSLWLCPCVCLYLFNSVFMSLSVFSTVSPSSITTSIGMRRL